MRGAWWWIDRWRKSTAYICMSIEEQGLYRNLIDAVWLFEGPIPDEPKALITASGGDVEAWARSGAKVLQWMRKVDGGWVNETALAVMRDSQDLTAKRAKSGALGAAAKWQRDSKLDGKTDSNDGGKRDGKTMPPSPSPSPSPISGSGSESREIESHAKRARSSSAGFEMFWAAYPKRVAKDAAVKAWEKRRPDAELQAQILAAVEDQKTWRTWREGFVPNPATWLNAGRWADEPTPIGQSHQRGNGRTTTAAAPRRAAIWACPHLEECPHRAACEIKLAMPAKYPVKSQARASARRS